MSAGEPNKVELREDIHERLGFLRMHAENGQRYCEMGDDVGLKYSLAALRAYLTAALGSGRDLIAPSAEVPPAETDVIA